MNFKEVLKEIVSTGGNCVNLGRSLQVKNKELYDWVIHTTKFLNTECKFTERVYCIQQDITEPVLNEDTITNARFINIFEGYCIKKQAVPPKVKKGRPAKYTKVQVFLTRNKRQNGDLYNEGMIDGYDYVLCPVSGARMKMITRDYITNVLEMSVDEYDTLYPNVKKMADKRIEKIKQNLKSIDEETGLTKHQLSVKKSIDALSKVDENGLSGYKKKGIKTKETHMANIDEHGRNGYSQLASKAIIKGNQTKADRGLILPFENRDEFYRYKSVVMNLTEKLRKTISKGYTTGLAGVNGAWHIDHQYSIMDGYTTGVSPFVIGHRENLKMRPWEENLEKHTRSSIRLNDLLSCVGYTHERSCLEFEATINFIREDIVNNLPVSGAKIIGQLYETILRK